jgi:hypothetical protein
MDEEDKKQDVELMIFATLRVLYLMREDAVEKNSLHFLHN